eukprot:COSAG02_NODE_5_length_66751_cov_63.939148_59_plen_80_part_00
MTSRGMDAHSTRQSIPVSSVAVCTVARRSTSTSAINLAARLVVVDDTVACREYRGRGVTNIYASINDRPFTKPAGVVMN